MTRESFSRENPALQLAWDSTSIGALKTCPRYYYYNIYLGYVPRAENVHLKWGTVYHEAIEYYDRARADGVGYEGAVRLAVRKTLMATWNEVLHRPWISDDKYKNRLTLLRSVVWYLTQFKEDPCETLILSTGKPAVELSFRMDWGRKTSTTGEDILLCGHLDRVATLHDKVWVMDKKSTKLYINPTDSGFANTDWFDRYSPDNQCSVYSYAGRIIHSQPISGVLYDVVQVAITFSRYQRGFALRSDAQLAEWRDDLDYWLAQAEHFATEGFWPMNDKSCGMYGGCPYRPICSRQPSVRQEWLNASYQRRLWDPLQVRGDI